MSWETTLVTFVRGLTNDLGPNQTNSDEDLEQLIVIAAMLVNQEIDFKTDYTINIEYVSIVPDPVFLNDDAFINLTALKTACMLARADQKDKARQAYNIKDGPSNIDGRAASEGVAKWSDTICKDYITTVLEYRLGNMQPGKAIIGPYRYDNSQYQTPISPRSNNNENGNFS